MFWHNKKETIPKTGFELPNKRIGVSSADFRDGQQSLFATRIKTEDMLSILEKMDQAGFAHIEMWGGATFDACIRFLGEDPWERIRLFKQHVKRTPLRMLLRGQNLVGYRQYADDVVQKFIYCAAANGIDIFQIFDGLNDVRNCELSIQAVKAAGKEAHGVVLYTISPVHNVEKYVKTAKEFADAGVSAIHLGDMAGQMTPEEAYKITRAIKEAVPLPLHIQCHATGGMADLAYWEAIRAGADFVTTAFSPLANGASLPATESTVAALNGTTADTGISIELLAEVSRYFVQLKSKYAEYLSQFTGVDIGVFSHQVPGGMLSNLESQLKGMNSLHLLDKVFEEVPLVRKDLGYPPLATPFSQMVGAQATTNVITGERYKIISKEVKNYLAGMYGRAPGPLSSDLAALAMGDKKAIDVRPGSLLTPEYEKAKEESRAFVKTEEDILTYALFGSVAEDFLRKKYMI